MLRLGGDFDNIYIWSFSIGAFEKNKFLAQQISFLGRAVARAPISCFVILPAYPPVPQSQLAPREDSRVSIGSKAVKSTSGAAR